MAEQQQQAVAEFTDAELIELANDPRVTSQHLAKLTPNEQRRFMALRQAKPDQERSTIDQAGEALSALGDAGTGAVKGLGKSVVNLGGAVNSVTEPIGNAIADLFGLPGHIDSSGDFAGAEAAMAPANKAESIGQTVEQIAEFLIPAGKVGPLSRGAANMVGKLSKASGPVRRMATDAAWKAAPIAENALGAGTVAAVHGDETPESAAMWSAGGGATGQALSQAARLLATPLGQKLGPYLAAIAAMSAAGGLTGPLTAGGIGAGMTGFGLANQVARSALRRPGAIGKLRWAAEDLGQQGGTLAAGVADQSRTPRRRSER